MPNKAWKTWERRVASVLRSRRTGPTGLDSADVVSADGQLAVECKYRHCERPFSAWLNAEGQAALAQAKINAHDTPTWGLALKDANQRGKTGELMVLPLAYFEQLYNDHLKLRETNDG